jgi:ParB-like chromosome segregation protein Spo0J
VAETELVIGDLPPQHREVQATEEDIKELAASIGAIGLKHPITVNTDGVVIDGLRRIQAFTLLKRKTIPAFVSDNYAELCQNIAAGRPPGRVMPLDRVLEIIESLDDARAMFARRRRTAHGSEKKHLPAAGVPIRRLMSQAVGLSESRVELLNRARRAAEYDAATKAKVEDLRSGRESMYGFQRWEQRRALAQTLPVTSADEVRTVMERGLRTIGTALEAMSKFGPASVLTRAEREQVLSDLIEVRTKVLRLHREVRGGLKDEVEEGK